MQKSLEQLQSWVESQFFQGWDPFDALNSQFLKRLTFNNRRLGQVWVQLFKHSPINLRPLFGVAKGYNPKGMGLFLAAYWRSYLLARQQTHLDHTRFLADWLQKNMSPGYHGACWGYNFDWPNRDFFAPAATPTIVNTAFNGLAFLDLFHLSPPEGRSLWDDTPLQTARSACEFVLHDLNRAKTAADECCFSYTPLDQRYIHNASVLGARLLAEVGAQTGEVELIDTALAAARYTARRQRGDGSWPYGEAANNGWVDNFHTAYVLVALKRIAQAASTNEFADVIEQGYLFWRKNFFLEDLTPKYYLDSIYPIDTHCAAYAIITLLEFAEQDAAAYTSAQRLAEWTIHQLQDKQGFFHYQIRRTHRIQIPYMRWTQAWMLRALAELAWVKGEK